MTYADPDGFKAALVDDQVWEVQKSEYARNAHRTESNIYPTNRQARFLQLSVSFCILGKVSRTHWQGTALPGVHSRGIYRYFHAYYKSVEKNCGMTNAPVYLIGIHSVPLQRRAQINIRTIATW